MKVLFALLGLLTISLTTLTANAFFNDVNPQRCVPKFTSPSSVRISEKPLFLIVHPQADEFDTAASSYVGLMQTYDWVTKFDIQSVVLVEDINLKFPSLYFMPNCEPNYFYKSLAGEFNFDVRANTVILSGGFFSACLRKALEDLLLAWGRTKSQAPRRIIIPAASVYEILYPFDGSKPADSPYFKTVKEYEKISGSHTMNLQQIMRVMGAEAFNARTKQYLSEKIDVPGVGESKLVFPSGYNVVLKVLNHEPSIDFQTKIVDLPAAPTLEIDMVDGSYLIGLTNQGLLGQSNQADR